MTVFRGGIVQGKIDDKGRLHIPAKYRKALSREAENKFFVTISPAPGCLYAHPLDLWKEFEKKLSLLPESPQTDAIIRRLYRLGDEFGLDSQGRIMLSSELLQSAKLDKDTVIAGVGKRLEIWNPQQWKELQEKDETPLTSGYYDLQRLVEENYKKNMGGQ